MSASIYEVFFFFNAIYSERKHIRGCLMRGWKAVNYSGHKVIFGGSGIFVILIIEMISKMSKLIKLCSFTYVPFQVLQLYLDKR